MNIIKSIVLTSLILSLFACSTSKETRDVAQASVTTSSNKNLLGEIALKAVDGGVLISTHVSGLDPKAVHAIHIHENGICEGDFSSAGAHFNPHNHSHGGPSSLKSHAGDLGNLISDANGKARSEVLIKGLDLKDVIGKAVIIHAKADDFISQPAGNAGDRIACGVIK